MDVFALLIFSGLLFFLISPPWLIHAQQAYTGLATANCNITNNSASVLGYTCNGLNPTCQAYLTFRSQSPYNTISSISHLLNSDPSQVSQINSISENSPLETGKLVIVPVKCSCTGSEYYQSNTSYIVESGESYFSIANIIFESLSTCQALQAQNTALFPGNAISVPLRCACPTRNQTDSGVKYLLTHVVTTNQTLYSISTMFGVNYLNTAEANELLSYDQMTYIYPLTTLLIPLQTPPFSLSTNNSSKKTRDHVVVGIVGGVGLLLIIGGIAFCVFVCRKNEKQRHAKKENFEELDLEHERIVDYSTVNLEEEKLTKSHDFPSIPSDLILVATNHFSEENKLGEGGFGPVYKGTLPDGKDIAVKRLSRNSSQGLREFKNEISLIVRLQHRNLVRLLGCCLEENELMLIYEYMPNKSLDFFLFDSTKAAQLDWKRRFFIINGIARGLLYLHEDSRCRIIHRDLKVSNILLDEEMNPKISDFGMARIFCANQTEAKTNRVVGTYGYMAPEYTMEGLFSVKSDVFSLGVLLLEIISGKRNSSFYLFEHGDSLLTYAWSLWGKGEGLLLDLMDPLLLDSYVATEVLKCIHIGLLCVQEEPADRPTMATIVNTLGSEIVRLPQPAQPAVSVGRSCQGSPVSANGMTISDVLAR